MRAGPARTRPPPRPVAHRNAAGAATQLLRKRGHHERLGRFGAAQVEGPRGVRRTGGISLGCRDDGVHPLGDVGRELLQILVREGEGVILAAAAAICDVVSRRSG